jgi:hypothetical protein
MQHPGEGTIWKSSTNEPSRLMAWARTPVSPGTRSASHTSGSSRCNAWVSPVEISGGAFTSANALQRAGLLGLSGSGGGAFTTIYVAFARTGSSAANHRGWVFSYRAPDLAPLSFYCVTCGASPANGGGIWQGGAGLASGTDSSGRTYLFIATGDGNFDLNTGGKNAGDSFLKMGTDLSVVDYLTPSDQACRICLQQGAERDVDFGAGGVTLIPDGAIELSFSRRGG